jgi:heptosyltransferase I
VKLPFVQAPRSVCILRLSAIGDTCHIVPVLRTMQQVWPATRFTWIIAKTESGLMRLIEGVEFIIVARSPDAASMRCCICSLPCAQA